MNIKDLQAKVLQHLEKEVFAPVTAEELIVALHLQGDELKNIWSCLEQLEAIGALIKTRFNTYGVPERMGLKVGNFQLTSKGFGFVLAAKPEEEDLFIAPPCIAGAMNGDKVLARVEQAATGRRPEGRILRIIEHAHKKVVGTFVRNGEFGFVVPDDKKLGQDIYILSRYFNKAQDGQKVVAEIIKWPEEHRSAEGKIAEILGNPGDVGLEILSIIKQNDLPLTFPPEVIAASEKIPQKLSAKDLAGRKDLRTWQIITIDGDDAKDFDDAVHVRRQGDKFVLGVYIADVSYYIRENSVLDKEAAERGTSVYLVDRVLPMLPERLSNGICSLMEGVDRLTMGCEMLFDAEGRLERYDIYPAVICSQHRMTYSKVRKILAEHDEELCQEYSDLVPMLQEMEKLAQLLKQRRTKRGALDFELPEFKVILDEQKHPVEIVPRVRSVAESIIEEFMLAANETVAADMTKQKWPFIYRVHDMPNKEKMVDLAKLLANFGVTLQLGKEEELEPKVIQAALAQMAGKPEERLVSTVALRSLKQAVYQTENIGHFGLAAEYYTHFTSPIRRYPDLLVHRILRSFWQHPKLGPEAAENLRARLESFASHCSMKERAAAEAERATVDLKMAEYMQSHVGEEFDGIISGVTAFGIFVELPNGVEGLVHISSLTDDYYEFSPTNYSLVGEHLGKTYRLGDSIQIEVLQVNLAERSVDFILAGESAATRDYLRGQLQQKQTTLVKKKKVQAKAGARKHSSDSPYYSTIKKQGKQGKDKRRQSKDKTKKARKGKRR